MKERPDSEVPTSGCAAELFASPPLRNLRLPPLSCRPGEYAWYSRQLPLPASSHHHDRLASFFLPYLMHRVRAGRRRFVVRVKSRGQPQQLGVVCVSMLDAAWNVGGGMTLLPPGQHYHHHCASHQHIHTGYPTKHQCYHITTTIIVPSLIPWSALLRRGRQATAPHEYHDVCSKTRDRRDSAEAEDEDDAGGA